MDHAIVYVLAGLLIILAVWAPLFLQRAPVSLAMVAVVVGTGLSFILDTSDLVIDFTVWTERVAEFALLVAVLGAGLKIDRRFSWRRWASTWRLLFVVMLLSIAAIALAGWWLFGLSPGLAILAGGALAPTDPVLAGCVQVGPPGEGDENEAKFGLTSEAGLNDGLAFPFVALGLAIAAGGLTTGSELLRWFTVDLLWNVAGGVVVGLGMGWTLVNLNLRLPEPCRLAATNSGLAAVGLAFLAYGLAAAIGCNGFLAMFCEALMVRNLVSSWTYSRRLNHAAEQFEQVAMLAVLAAFGMAIGDGLLAGVGLQEAGFAMLVLLVVRPAATFLAFLGSAADIQTRAALGYFGMRGIGSLYYAIYAVLNGPADAVHRLTPIVGLVVLASIFLYGTTTELAIRLLKGSRGG